jgi:hypothetical protein
MVKNIAIIGFDPGYVNLGWAMKYSQKFRTGLEKLEGSRTERLLQVKDLVDTMMAKVTPDIYSTILVGVERLPVGVRAVIIMLESVISVLEMRCAEHGAEVYTMAPRCHKSFILHGDKVNKSTYPSKYNEIVKSKIPKEYRVDATQHSLDASGVLFTLESYYLNTDNNIKGIVRV